MKRMRKVSIVMLCVLIFAAVFAVMLPTTVTVDALTKNTIYVDTSGIDARTDLTAAQKTALKDGILNDIRANLEQAVGEENVEVSNDPAKEAGASRKVKIVNEHNPGYPPKRAWGGRVPGSDTAKVYLKNFLDIARPGDPFKTDGNLDMDKLANAIGHTAGHELGHTFSVGHNENTGDDVNKMTKGGNYGANEKANNVWVYDDHTDRLISENWEKAGCAAKVDYEVETLIMHYWDEPLLPGESEEFGGLDVLFHFSGLLASEFYFGFLGPDSDGGFEDGNSEFDFIYKSSMEGLGADAQMLTFFQGSHDYTQFLLKGAPGSSYEDQWFMLDEEDLHLYDFVTQPDGDYVARLVVMEWDVDGILGIDVQVTLDANAFGEYSNPYNGLTYEFPAKVGGIVEFPRLEEPGAVTPDSSGHNDGAAAGIIAGAIAGVTALISATWYIRRQRTKAT